MLFSAVLIAATLAAAEPPETVKLRALMAETPKLPHQETELPLRPALPVEMVSSVAVAPDGLIYILQRSLKADPMIVARSDGAVLRTWGRGMYKIPHSVRIDPRGNVWTVDAGDSTIRQFTPLGRQLLKVTLELPAKPRSEFCGTADIAFAAKGHFWVADGYQNTRIVEFDAGGKRLREFGTPGTGPGQFHLPHGIAIDKAGRIFVADRENGRIQRFDGNGKYLGEWNHLGKTFSLRFAANGDLWIGTQPRNVPNGAEGWLVRVDPSTAKTLGRIDTFGHSVEVTNAGEVLTGRRPGSTLRYLPR